MVFAGKHESTLRQAMKSYREFQNMRPAGDSLTAVIRSAHGSNSA